MQLNSSFLYLNLSPQRFKPCLCLISNKVFNQRVGTKRKITERIRLRDRRQPNGLRRNGKERNGTGGNGADRNVMGWEGYQL